MVGREGRQGVCGVALFHFQTKVRRADKGVCGVALFIAKLR